jgi:hypothetical protein
LTTVSVQANILLIHAENILEESGLSYKFDLRSMILHKANTFIKTQHEKGTAKMPNELMEKPFWVYPLTVTAGEIKIRFIGVEL